MQIQDLVAVVRRHLGPHLLRPDFRKRRPEGATASWGCCYVAAEAIYHLAHDPHLVPTSVRVGDVVHWYLRGPDGVVDPTSDQFKTAPDYSQGRGRGFLTAQPSKRAQRLIDAVKDELASISG